MSLSGALSNALSGLTANARAASLVSSNISNAMTEGYGRRELAVGSNTTTGGGVRVDGVTRHVNPVILSDRRMSDAETASGEQLLAFASRMETLVGDSTQSGSLAGRMAAFENALITAASNPSSVQRLDTLSRAAEDLATTFNRLSDGIQSARQDADRAIRFQVEALNDNLGRVEKLNQNIAMATRMGRDASALMDERQKAIDAISSAVPLRSVAREDGVVALFTTKGQTLVDGHSVKFDFAETPIILPDMSQAGGGLSGLRIDGKTVDTSLSGPIHGGALGAQFQIRDQDAPRFQAQLDGIARDVIERLGAGGPDTTIGITDSGVFVDGQAPFDPINEIGVAARIALNADLTIVNGQSWRLRDGLNAPTPGEVGDARLLNALYETLTTAKAPTSSSLDRVARSVAGFMSEWSSGIGSFRVRQEGQQTYAQAQNVALTELVLAEGVDTDRELQFLMLLEQSFQANAKVMTTVDEMLQTILSI